jgi:hypothetical protein
MPNDIKLRDVRGSFLTLGEPEYYQGKKQREKDERRWSTTFLIPYDSPQLKAAWAAMEEVAKEKWGAKYKPHWENLTSDSKLCCLIDGKKKAYDGYAGNFALTAHRSESKGRPLVLDSDKSPIYKPDNGMYPGKAGRVYSGCYLNGHVSFWAQDNANGKAIRCELLGVQRVRDGDAFSGGMAPDESAFDEITEGSDADDLS